MFRAILAHLNRFQTSIEKGDLRTLVRVSFPIMFFVFCEALTLFYERIILSECFQHGVHCSLNGTYLANVFQNPCMAIAMMAQVFVGFAQGEENFKSIGPCVWQLIWFSFLSLLITVPLGFWSSFYYFKGTIFQQEAREYFTILSIGNFLFPLSMALGSFYLGRGKTFLVTSCTLLSYALQLLFCRMLISGIRGIIPAFGIRGAALAKCLSLGIFCLFFFCTFLTKKNREIYQTGHWHLSPRALWTYIQPGMVRAFGYFCAKGGWIIISYLMIQKGDWYLNVLTVGGTLISFLVFIVIGLYRSVLTIASNLLGAKKYTEIWRLCYSCISYIAFIALILAIPLLIFPQSLIYCFDSSLHELFVKTFKTINHWVWLYLVANGLQMSLCAVLVAAKDLRVQFYMYLATFLTSLLPVYLAMHLGGWSANKLWLIMAVENIIGTFVFFYRLRQKKWEEVIPVTF